MTSRGWLASFGLATGITLGGAAGANADDPLAFVVLLVAAVIVVALAITVLRDHP